MWFFGVVTVINIQCAIILANTCCAQLSIISVSTIAFRTFHSNKNIAFTTKQIHKFYSGFCFVFCVRLRVHFTLKCDSIIWSSRSHSIFCLISFTDCPIYKKQTHICFLDTRIDRILLQFSLNFIFIWLKEKV